MDTPLQPVQRAGSFLLEALAGPTREGHFAATYFSLRFGMIILAAGLPIYLVVIGKLGWDVGLQDSLSAYYHAEGGSLRDEFVGTLCAVGVFLILYRGFNRLENIALNVAGLALIGVAVVPMAWRCGDACSRISDLHGVFAYTFFAGIFYVAFLCSSNTLIPEIIPDEGLRNRYRNQYRGLSVAMGLAVVFAGAIAFVAERNRVTIVLESVGVWAFAAYWVVKGNELRRPALQKLLNEGRIEPAGGSLRHPLTPPPVRVLPPQD